VTQFTPNPKHKRIALKRNSVGWKKLVKEVFERDGYRCFWCSEKFHAMCLAPHHLKTVGASGDDTADNLITLCKEDHLKVHTGEINLTKLEEV